VQKPFLKLGEVFGVKPSQEGVHPEKAISLKFDSWEALRREVKPLTDKNLVFSEPPKVVKVVKEVLSKRRDEERSVWPPKPLEVYLPLTSEYIEGKKECVSHETLRRLRDGKFSVKAVLNLRRLTVEEALLALEDFFRKAIELGYSCVLVVHGRGLSSPNGEPVLKPLFKSWLERGPYRRHVLAYASARPCDGGLGATYVLLSQRPVKK
jgi:DNA-nicking Smr family endonuclease